MNNNYEELTVKQLREISRERGLTLESKGHKFTKQELIERLVNDDAEMKEPEKEQDNETWIAPAKQPEVKEQKEEVKSNIREDGYIIFAGTLEEIVQKYGNRKKQSIYDNELNVGCYVVFVHYVESKHGDIYKKLRTAKVVGVNRKKERVRVVTLLGTEIELGYDDLLYIKGAAKECSYPKDINTYLKHQRTEKGRAILNERFTGSVAAN